MRLCCSAANTPTHLPVSDIHASRRKELGGPLRRLDMSRYEFSSRFLKYYKTTFRDYIFQKRIACGSGKLCFGFLPFFG